MKKRFKPLLAIWIMVWTMTAVTSATASDRCHGYLPDWYFANKEFWESATVSNVITIL